MKCRWLGGPYGSKEVRRTRRIMKEESVPSACGGAAKTRGEWRAEFSPQYSRWNVYFDFVGGDGRAWSIDDGSGSVRRGADC